MSESEQSADVPAKKVGRDPVARDIAATAKRLRSFTAAHGGAGRTFVEYVSATRTRVVAVAGDGTWGDVVLPSHDAAMSAVERAGLEVTEEWDRESSGAVRTSATEWKRMAGST